MKGVQACDVSTKCTNVDVVNRAFGPCTTIMPSLNGTEKSAGAEWNRRAAADVGSAHWAGVPHKMALTGES